MPSTNLNEPRAPIAIVGLACRFPGDASNPSKFWDLLKNGRDASTQKTNRYNENAWYHPGGTNKRQNVLPVKGGYLLKQDPYVFDAAFFNITAAEATAFDPKQRIAMEVAYEALENAGMPLQKVAGTQTSCFIGTSISDYRDSVVRDFGNIPKYHLLGTSDEMLSNRISHFLDIHGPSATIETACSSSHVATHLACQSLQSGESDMAIAGGVGMILDPGSTMQLNNLQFLSSFGQSRAFDETAGGYARGEGCGIIVLKRLDKAIQDGDNIRAVIRGTGVNSDGWTQGVTFPSGEAQAALIRYVYESNGLDYGSTQYVETHGTGTHAGDPIEARAIYHTIGQGGMATNPSRKKLWFGSVKPNIGHLESAAGMASLIKGVLAMEHGVIPPTIHLSKPNPAIEFEEWNMAVPTKLTNWPACQVRRMSSSAFGMGGTNAHIVFERPSNQALLQSGSNGANGIFTALTTKTRLFVFSSHDQAGFKRLGNALVEHLDTVGPAASGPEYLANLSHTLAAARSGLSWKSSCLAESAAELREKLLTTLGENATRASSSQQPRIGFVFTGQGAQWARMGVEMLERSVFSNSVSRSAAMLRDMGCDWDPVTELAKVQKESRLGVPEISQPICTVLQIALVDELWSWGIRPSKVVGHSSGEIAAAYCIGALTHSEALAAAYYRGKASAGIKHLKGGMMAVQCSPEEAVKLMSNNNLNATVACVNAPSSITLSGDVDTLEAIRAIFDERGLFARRLKVDVAYHSAHMYPCSAEYSAAIAHLDDRPAIPDNEGQQQQPPIMVSSVTGGEVDPELLGPHYWVRNLVSPVLFSDAVKELLSSDGAVGSVSNDVDILIEIGPHSALGGPVKQILSHHGIKNVRYMSMLTRGENALHTSLSLAAELFRHSLPMDVPKVNDDSHCRLLTDLPPYPWNHSQRFRAESRVQRELFAQKFPTTSILGAQMPSMGESERVWRGFIRLDDEPWLRDHTIGTTVLFPGAGVISAVLEAAQQIADPGKTPYAFTLRDVSFLAAMPLTDGVATEFVLHMRPHLVATRGSTPAAWWEFSVSFCTGAAGELRNSSRGLISITYEDSRSPQMVREDAQAEAANIADYRRILHDCPEECSKEDFYNCLAKSGLRYGEHFQGVEKCYPGNGKTAFEVRLVDLGETFAKGKLDRPFLIHAAALDSMLQASMGSTSNSNGSGSFGFDVPMIPKSIGELVISVDMPADVGYMMPGFSRSKRHGFNEWSADVTMLDRELSKVFLSVSDFRMAELEVDNVGESGREGDVEVDPTDIASEIHWNYALDVLKPEEIRQVLSSVATTTVNHRLVELVRMIIHQSPGMDIVELVTGSEELTDTVMSKLPSGFILPTQVRYALVNSSTNISHPADAEDKVFGRLFSLGPLDTPLAADTTPADVFVIPYHVMNSLQKEFDSILERLSRLAKPNAMFLIVGPDATTDRREIPSRVLKAKGLELRSSIPMGTDSLTLYHYGKKEKAQPEKLANGSTGEKVVILEPLKSSPKMRTFSKELQTVLDGQGYTVSTKTGVDSVEAGTSGAKTFVSLLELEQPFLEDLSESDFHSVRALMLNCERLLWVTRGDSPALRMVDGFSRVMRSEFAGARFQVLHLSSERSRHGPELAARVLLIPTEDSEFREQNGFLQVSRIFPSLKENKHIGNHLYDSTRVMSLPNDYQDENTASFRLVVGKPGLLDTLHFVRDESMAMTPLADDEVELQVKASGINFRDIMGSMGLFAVTGLGQEASGVVVRTGKLGAKSLKPGDRVSTMTAGGAHATRFRSDYRVTHKIPDAMSFEEAAGVPVAYCTAYYALIRLAKLRRGQSVLIHAAAGGTGQAAVQLAKHLGVVVYATVGTEEKRRLLIDKYSIPEEHIFNSRDGSFAKGIQRVTGNRGVDCVLNSLSGELLRLSWTCLAIFGIFVEIGLRDITDNMRLDMGPFGKSTTFSFINIVTLLQENPHALGEILHEVFKLVNEGVLRPAHPVTVYPLSRIEDAFRIMQRGKHLGKMILSFTQDEARARVQLKAKDSLKLDPNATYLIVGGLGGLGRSLAMEFVASGARHIAFLSRSGDTKPEAKTVVDQLTAHGAQVKVYRCDIADDDAFLEAMEQCSQELPPVKGVVQMAMVLRDIVFEKMSYEEWTIPLRPKVQGTWNLHRYFGHERPLDFMILCSSTAGVSGNPSQAQYAAGNTFQDALASYRRAEGLKAVAVNLGIMRDVGVLAEQMESHFLKVWERALGIREPAFHALMKRLITGQQQQYGGAQDDDGCPAQVCVGLGTGNILATHGLDRPAYFEDPRFGPLAVTSVLSNATAKADGAAASIASRLSEASANKDPTVATSIITDALVMKVADILRIPPSEVDPSRPMYRYGVDSLVALEVRNWITKETKANMTLLDILSGVPMKTLAVQIAKKSKLVGSAS